MYITNDYILAIGGILVLVGLLVFKRLPSTDSFEHFLNALNSKGGNILILSAFTYLSLIQTVRWFYHILYMVSQKQLNESNAIATLGAQFLTTTAFGMFAGALISTLTGLSTKKENGGSTNAQVETGSTTATDKPTTP